MTALLRAAREPRAAVSAGATLVLGLVVLVAARWGPDWPAQEFRAWIAAHDGFEVWTSRWYGGSALPGYSVLYPPLAGTLGAGTTGLLAAVCSAWAAAGLAPASRIRARCYLAAVVALLVQNLLIGQVPFLLGTAFGVLSMRLLFARRHSVLVFAAAALCSLASPLPAAFLLIAVPALATATSWRRALPVAGAFTGLAVSALVGGASGPFPCQWQCFASIVVACAIIAWLAPRDNRALKVFAICYLIAGLVAFLVPNPIGGNMGRLGKLVALPLACHFLIVRGTLDKLRAAVVVALAALWPTIPFTTAALRGATDASQHPAFYAGLTRFLSTQSALKGRLEIPFTREHWETLWVARHYPIARGWERQEDLLYNAVLYHPLTARSYRAWLDDNAVSLVALPNVPIDSGGRAEAQLLRHPPGYLRPTWHDANWQVWRVVHPSPLVEGTARLTTLAGSSMTLQFRSAGTALVRIRASDLWQVSSGVACLAPPRDGWLQVRAARAGTVRLDAALSSSLVTDANDCRS